MPTANYDETQIPNYTLPDPLVSNAGARITSKEQWVGERRDEILQSFNDHVFGRTPPGDLQITFHIEETAPNALKGLATRKQIRVEFERNQQNAEMDILLYLPNDRQEPAPIFTGLNFCGNQTIHSDPDIRLARSWIDNKVTGVIDNRATTASRGTKADHWAVESILERGYGLATAYCGDLDPDFDDGFQNGVHALFAETNGSAPAANRWGAIGAWAWGLSRIMDYCEQDGDVDGQRVIVMGHSRLGKTALWAGAQDERFALVVSNNSGCGGAALSRRRFGETVTAINTRFPHWFCANFRHYNDREDDLPVDQHQLLALMAPRPLYVASAIKDGWADPRGEYLSAFHTTPVYRLFGGDGPDSERMPDLHQTYMRTIGYHIRAGGHSVTEYDWQRYLDFADLHLGRPDLNTSAGRPAT